MSELQAALLAIGLGVVVAVYLFGWWKQRQYRRKFGAAFSQSHDDALYQGHDIAPVVLDETGQEVPDLKESGLEGPGSEEPVLVNQDAVPTDAEVELLPAVHDMPAVPEVIELPVASAVLNEPCALLDIRSDFIIELHLDEPSAAAVLDGLWQRKFDFKKPVQVCGLTLSGGQWERVIAESQTLYSKFRIALQLVDRSGVISVARLGDFRDLVQGIAQSIHADATVPDVAETYQNAQSLDAFCAEVDRMVGVNLMPSRERLLNGRKVSAAATLQGMKLESDGAFHLLNTQGNSLITLINKDTRPFQHHTLDHFTTPGLTLLLDVPRVERPAVVFDDMLLMARAMGRELQVNLQDDHNVLLTELGLARIRTQIAEVEAKMCASDLIPGSAQALRLFS